MLSIKGFVISILWILVFFMGISTIKLKNTIVSFPFKNMQYEIRYFFIVIAFWMFGICVQDTYDIYWYRYLYENRMPHGKEPLFDLLQFSLHDLGVSFSVFRFLWITVIAVLLFRGIRKYADYPSYVFALSIFSILSSFVTQLRSAMVCAIILNIIPLLFTGKTKDRITYIIIVVLCAQLHIVGYAYLFLIVLKRGERRIYKGKYYILVAALTVLAIGMNSVFGNLTLRLLSYIPALENTNSVSRIASSIDGIGAPIKSAVFLVFKHVFLYVLTDYACSRQLEDWTIEYRKRNVIEIIREMNMLFLLFIPIAIIDESFERIFNPMCFIQYAMIFNVRKEKVGLSSKISISIPMDYVLIGLTILMYIVSLKSNPDDFIRMMNSLSFR